MNRKHYHIRTLAVIVVLLLGACQADDEKFSPEIREKPDIELTVPQAWMIAGIPITSFHYQLQNVDPEALGNSAYPLLIIDYSRDGSSEGAYTREEITALKEAGNQPRLVLAYLSIGEAESYRTYWQENWRKGAAPDWLQEENPEWAENYLVNYWDPDWQALIFGSPESSLDQILRAGFDGVYLDKVDSYQSFPQLADADQRMVDFVLAIAAYARQQAPNFVIVSQNGIDLAVNFPEYLRTLDAVGQEDVFYGYPRPNQPSAEVFLDEIIPQLDDCVDQGVPVLAISYADQPGQIQDNLNQCNQHGYLCFSTTRALDQFISDH